jgi:hypothetical protein
MQMYVLTKPALPRDRKGRFISRSTATPSFAPAAAPSTPSADQQIWRKIEEIKQLMRALKLRLLLMSPISP